MAISNVVFAIAMMLVLLRITQYLSLLSTRLFVMRRSASNALVMLKCANPKPDPNPNPNACSSAASRPLRPLAPIPTFTLPTPLTSTPHPTPLTSPPTLAPAFHPHPFSRTARPRYVFVLIT